MPLADAILDGIGFTIGGKVVEHLHKKMKRKNTGKTNSGSFIGVRVNGSKVQLKLPNKNPSTLKAAKAVANKLGYRINSKYLWRWRGFIYSGGKYGPFNSETVEAYNKKDAIKLLEVIRDTKYPPNSYLSTKVNKAKY